MQLLLHCWAADGSDVAVADFAVVTVDDDTVPADFRDCWVWISLQNEMMFVVAAGVVVVADVVAVVVAAVAVADDAVVAVVGVSAGQRASFAAVPPCALLDMHSSELVSFYQC